MFSSLPTRPNLNHLKKQAKDLLRGFRTREASALERIKEWHPQILKFVRTPDLFCLSDAQLVIAREYQFESWPKLKNHVVGPGSRESENHTQLKQALENLRQGK